MTTFTYSIGAEVRDSLVIKAESRDEADKQFEKIAWKKYDSWWITDVSEEQASESNEQSDRG